MVKKPVTTEIMQSIAQQQKAVRAVLGEILTGRDQVLQITVEKLASICDRHGLASDLPPVSCGLEQVWRARLSRAMGGTVWSIKGRRWRVRCPHGENFRMEPVRRFLSKKSRS